MENNNHDRRVQPTLFIGLGGTGKEILERVRQRILGASWGDTDTPVSLSSPREFPLAQFVYYEMDVSAGAGRALTITGAEFTNDEKIVKCLDIEKYFGSAGDLEKYPHIQNWLPITPSEFHEWVGHGTGQVRALSRLYFFDKYPVIRDVLRNKINQLGRNVFNEQELHRLGLESDKGLRIVVITSLVGGTGSGAFLDMGYLAKHLAEESGFRGARVDLIALLPSGYVGFSKQHIQANGYASLMELETLMTQDVDYVGRWDRYEQPSLPMRPYDEVYLCDTANLAGESISDVRGLYEMVANALFTDLNPLRFSQQKHFIAPHQAKYKIGMFTPYVSAGFGELNLHFSKVYSAFGQYTLDTAHEQEGEAQLTENLFDSLRNHPDRAGLFDMCLKRAMPWVDADLSGEFVAHEDNFRCVVGVANADQFEIEFGDEFRLAASALAGIPSHLIIWFRESGDPSKLTCYVEFSGLPLTALRQMRNWRISYDMESKKIPVHTHKDTTMFVHPVAPTSDELGQLAVDYQLFLQAVALGVLRQCKGTNQYEVKCQDYHLAIGNERAVRLGGMSSEQRGVIEQQLADALDKARNHYQLAGLATLYEYYVQEAFRPRFVKYETGVETRSVGLGYIMCRHLHDQSIKEFSAKAKVQKLDEELILDRLNTDMDAWTEVIPGSEKDGYLNEVHEERQAKRAVKPEFFEAGWLERLVAPSSPSEPLTAGKPWAMPPPLPAQANLQCWIAIDGQRVGPLDTQALAAQIAGGTLTPQTLIWYQGLADWMPASQAPNVAALFVQAPPSLPPQQTPRDHG